MSLMNVVLKRTGASDEPTKSKERLILQVGYRRFIVNPIFSQHTNGSKHKIILAKSSTALVAEKDYYKHYDVYDDYEYDDATLNKAQHTQTDEQTITPDATSEINMSGVKNGRSKAKIIKDVQVEKVDNDDDDVTYILTDKPSRSYEVTEIVDDIPNPVTFKPIVTNFTVKLPLNNATVVNTNENNQNNKGRKNSISIFHVNAEFEDDQDKRPNIQNINIHKIPFGIFKIKDKVKDDVFNYVHSGELYENHDGGHYLPNIFSAPGHFLRRLREKLYDIKMLQDKLQP